MREIKFRLWNANARMMETKATTVAIAVGTSEMESTTGETHIVMQCTGLKDKNGVEIYEGDIITWVYYQIYGAEKKQGVIVFEKGCFYPKWGNIGYRLGGSNTTDIEVIGNIYENPELVEQDQ